MYRVIELTLSKRMLQLFKFLKHSPTRALKNGDYYKLLYFEPIGCFLSDFSYKGVTVKVISSKEVNIETWELIRDLPIQLASQELIEILEDLEKTKLEDRRQGIGIELTGWILDTITTGIFTKKETAAFIRTMFVYGYDFEQVTKLFGAIARRKDLASYFLATATKLYKGVEFG